MRDLTLQEVINSYIEKGWVLGENNWLHKEPGLGIHLMEDRDSVWVDCKYNCPYIPQLKEYYDKREVNPEIVL